MKRYIDKDSLVAEIEKLVDKGKYHEEYDCAYRDGNNAALYALKGRINDLEVKEVDLKEEIDFYIESSLTGTNPIYTKGAVSCIIEKTAKHFYELGLKVKDK